MLRTVNGGASWQDVSPPGASALQFRDIEAFDEDHAVILSIGTGADSRIYVTSDGGATWALTFTNDDPNAFYDCITFFDQKRGLALSDPVDGRFRILATEDGGRTWQIVDADMPPALAGEFAFAASGQRLVSDHGRTAWFATGGGAEARVFRSEDRGRTWTASSTPIPSSPSAGIFALAFRGQQHGLAVGETSSRRPTRPTQRHCRRMAAPPGRLRRRSPANIAQALPGWTVTRRLRSARRAAT